MLGGQVPWTPHSGQEPFSCSPQLCLGRHPLGLHGIKEQQMVGHRAQDRAEPTSPGCPRPSPLLTWGIVYQGAGTHTFGWGANISMPGMGDPKGGP